MPGPESTFLRAKDDDVSAAYASLLESMKTRPAGSQEPLRWAVRRFVRTWWAAWWAWVLNRL